MYAEGTKTGPLSRRAGPGPRTTPQTPHVQLDQPAPEPLQGRLWERMVGLPGVLPGRSGISLPSSAALHLEPRLAAGPREAYLVGTEFAHLHGDGSGSLHLALPEARAAEVIEQGWAELHPATRMTALPDTWVMVYGPRDDDELAVVWRLVEESYDFALGPR